MPTADTTTAPPASTVAPAFEDDDFLAGATACSIQNGEDCEACQ